MKTTVAARVQIIVASCLIVAIGWLLTACDNSPASAVPTATAPLVPTATVVAMAGTTLAAPTNTPGAALPTLTPCPPIAPPPTLTAAPTPSDYTPGTPQAGLPIATLQFRAACRLVPLKVQIASTDAQQAQGLMGRTDLPQDEGMLFDFGRDDSNETFWMKNTPNPLSIAFISGDLYIVSLDEMAAFDDQNFHASKQPYHYAVEANAGFFTRYGIAVGDKVDIIKP